MSVWRFAQWLPDIPAGQRVSLGEGNTPLVRSLRIGPQAGLENLWFKLEGANPSGSYKDRFAAVAVSKMRADSKSLCLATSSGNTGASLAAYCARAGIECRIAIVEAAPRAKLLQMQAYGAQLVRIRGFGTEAAITEQVFSLLEAAAAKQSAALAISAFRYSPVGMAGVETISFEIVEQLAAMPDHVFCQAGGGGLTLAVARGCETLVANDIKLCMPRIECAQPAGNATIAGPLRAGAQVATPVQCTTKISGLQVANVIDGDEVIAACRRSGGTGHLVDDEEVYRVQSRLAREEGIFCEPAGAVAVAAALKARQGGEIQSAAPVVCLLTGSGFKDMPSLEHMAGPDSPLRDVKDLETSGFF